MTKYIVGTRGSKLSLAQTNQILEQLTSINSGISFETKIIKTMGDKISRPLYEMNQRGIFAKEIDCAVLDDTVDFAVHSMKDVPSDMDSELIIASVPTREAVNDILITKNNHTLDTIPSGSLVGTSSLRRAIQVSRLCDDIIVKPIRGNIETRINNVMSGKYDAIILAQAGITRLKLDLSFVPLSTSDFVPSPGQGALALVCRHDNLELSKLLKTVQDSKTRQSIDAERAFSESVDSGCRFPVGVYANISQNTIHIDAVTFSADGKDLIKINTSGSSDKSWELGKELGLKMIKMGADKFAQGWRQEVNKWNKQV